MIEVKNVSKVYGKKKNVFEALKDATFTIPRGVTTAVIGKSGSGKSTLMHVMSGLDHATSGNIKIDGKSLSDMNHKAIDAFRAHQMSFIFQSFFVEGNETCYNNVSLPLEIADVPRKKRKKLITEALEAVELSEKINEKAKNLSGGQKQRLAIARAIVNKPKILFADEPTGNLDSQTGEKIEQLLFSYARKENATLIVVTHDHDLAKKCRGRIHMKDGRIEKIEGLKT
jgi:putative ABC transport system ATP-binding protein